MSGAGNLCDDAVGESLIARASIRNRLHCFTFATTAEASEVGEAVGGPH